MNKLVQAIALSVGFAGASAQADNLPNPFCSINDKGVATVYTRVEAGEFRPEVRSAGAVRREVGKWEGLTNTYHKWKGDGIKPAATAPIPGVTDKYNASTEMFSVNNPKGKKWVPEYAGAIAVNITGWKLNEAQGTCTTGSMNTGDTGESMPIIPVSKHPTISTGETQLRPYKELTP